MKNEDTRLPARRKLEDIRTENSEIFRPMGE